MSPPVTTAASMLSCPYPWTPDQGDDTYRNPIVCADYSDPDVIRDGDDFWMTASSFNCTPGLPILHSRDLVNWTIVNHAVVNLPDPRKVYHEPQHGCGVWAPAIRKHNNKFWIFFPQVDEGIYVTTADDPRGTWSEPHMLVEGKGLIDPCPLWDDDGKAYVVHAYANSRAGIKHKLRVRPMAPDGSKLLGEGQIVFDDPTNHPTLEGPKFHKRNGYYYISAPAGGVATGWQVILRSRNVYGPYEPRIVLHQGSTPINGPHQGAIVDTPDGKEWWFIHFQELQPYGRIVHLQPMSWDNDWPVMGVNHNAQGVGQPVLAYRKPHIQKQAIAVPQTSDEFDQPKLALQWQWHANHQDDWHTLTARQSHLRLRAISNPNDFSHAANLLLQKTPGTRFSVETRAALSPAADTDQAGLIIMGKTHAALVIAPGPAHPQVLCIIDNRIVESHPLRNTEAVLRVSMNDGGVCSFSFAQSDEPPIRIEQTFQASEGRWIGAKVGIFCRCVSSEASKGHADFDYFRFQSPAP